MNKIFCQEWAFLPVRGEAIKDGYTFHIDRNNLNKYISESSNDSIKPLRYREMFVSDVVYSKIKLNSYIKMYQTEFNSLSSMGHISESE
jgi:hypothetical protein